MGFVAKQDISCLQVQLKQLELWFSSSTRPVAVAEYHYPETILSFFDFNKGNKVFNLGLAISKFLYRLLGLLAELDAKKLTPESDCCSTRQRPQCVVVLSRYLAISDHCRACVHWEVGLIWR